MSAQAQEDDDNLDDFDDLLPDDLAPKGRAAPLARTKKQAQRTVAQVEADKVKAERETERLREQATAQRLAQIVNLHIAGHSLADIGASIGATADEVDRMLQQDAQRYVRSQPALRIYVRNYISKHYSDMLAVDMPVATDVNNEHMLEHQDRAIKLLDKMAKLHGADAPVQSEVKVEAAPESIDRMVQALSAQAGRAYDTSIFDEDDDDIVEAEIVEVSALQEAVGEALEVSGNAVGDDQEDDAWT